MHLLKQLIILLFIFLSTFLFGAEKDTVVLRIEKIKSSKTKVQQYDLAATNSWQHGNYEKTIEYADLGLKIANENNYLGVQAHLLNNKGIAYDYLGNYSESLKNYFQALKIQEKLDDPDMEASILSNIGLIYSNQGLYDKALSYHKRSLKIHREKDNLHGISATLNNIAIVLMAQNKFKEAIDNYLECIRIDKEMNDIRGLGDDYNNIGICYMDMKEYSKSMEYFQKALEIRKQANNPLGITETYTNIATNYYKLGDLNKAKEYFEKSIVIANEIGHKESLRYTYNNLYQIEERLGNNSNAFKYFKLYISYRDSLENLDQARLQTELELNYQHEKEKEKDRLEQEKKDAQSRVILYSVVAGFILILFFSIILYGRWKITQKQKKIIEEKSQLLETKNREILDSINYAKRIQAAILPSMDFFNKCLPKSYIIYTPKDIVAGDFYWLEEHDSKLYLAVADCTGHGVPGALMSVVCHNALNRSILEFGSNDPGSVLDKTRELIINDLSKNDHHVNDGMDISLCQIDQENNCIKFSGAQLGILMVDKDSKEINLIKGDKQPIGLHDGIKPFTVHELKLKPNTRYFMFSDGIADQFGGDDGKKLMSKRLRQWIQDSSTLSMSEQRSYLLEQFNLWKGNHEQVDDVCLIGFEL